MGSVSERGKKFSKNLGCCIRTYFYHCKFPPTTPGSRQLSTGFQPSYPQGYPQVIHRVTHCYQEHGLAKEPGTQGQIGAVFGAAQGLPCPRYGTATPPNPLQSPVHPLSRQAPTSRHASCIGDKNCHNMTLSGTHRVTKIVTL